MDVDRPIKLSADRSVEQLLGDLHNIRCRYLDCEDVFENRIIVPGDTVPVNDADKFAKLRGLIQQIGEICDKTLPG